MNLSGLDAIEERARAATPGPYEARCKEFCNLAKPRHIWSEYGWIGEYSGISAVENAEFAAHSISDISLLCERLRYAVEALALFASGRYIEPCEGDQKGTLCTCDDFNPVDCLIARTLAKITKDLGRAEEGK